MDPKVNLEYIEGSKLEAGEMIYRRYGTVYRAKFSDVPFCDPSIVVMQDPLIVYPIRHCAAHSLGDPDRLTKFKCSHCGQFGEQYSACWYCGAPVG